MRAAIVGAGPAGLYLAYLIKRRLPDADIRVFEQNPADATFGFGVAFSERALEFLGDDDPQTLAAIRPHMQTWTGIAHFHRGEWVLIDGIFFAGIGRLALLQLLQARARSVGIEPLYRHAVASLNELGEVDLIVGADGVNSVVRRAHADKFGTTIDYFTNRFAWYGTPRRFETLGHTFIETDFGHINAHHHRHADDMSTFVIEVDEATFFRAGLDRRPQPDAQKLCERVFAGVLDGLPLVSNNSIWRQFPKIWNRRWSYGNCVLIGDALHTAHFSIGSGTRLGMEDAIALDAALARHPHDIPAALADYESSRRPIVEKLVAAANASGDWYEKFADHMRLAPLDFAMSYIQRSGRVDRERLRALSPQFVARWERERGQA
jgi:2-polyprenyl-6-methoxyphenol hydroxylase-like FAD-dependent oxidoreductase